ncbi:MAG: hypothetical protein GY863_11015 [bacterium]|nr:hypothetical protein [bacterium]
MGANFKSFEVGTASGVLVWIMYIIMAAIAGFIIYKIILYYQEQRKWAWLTEMCKEKKLSQREQIYLKNLAVKKNFTSEDDIYGSLFSLNLPTPIKRKLL